MPIATKLHQFFKEKKLLHQSLHHSKSDHLGHAIELANASPEVSAKCIPLIDKSGPAVAVISFLADLDLDIINQTFNRHFQFLNDATAGKLFNDCESGAIPIFAMAYGLPVIVDEDLLNHDHVFSASGCSSTLLRVPGSAFRVAMTGAIKGKISKWPQVSQISIGDALCASSGNMSIDVVAKKLQKLYQLPPMPETAIRIMHLVADPESDVNQLSKLIERDPSLSAQIMRYANSALFNYRGSLNSIKDAVNKVLGFDRVSQLAMGIAASKAFHIPDSGPFGIDAFWTHALYAGVFAQGLALMANPDLAIDENEAYMAGLLHNFGILLIGHLFPPEFKMLNKLRESDADASMFEIEQQVFGMGGAQEFISLGHGTIGAILLKMWGMKDSAVKAAAMHHNFHYQGESEHYVCLVQLANYYLSQYGIGDECCNVDPEVLLGKLGIDGERASVLVETSIAQCQSLDGLICEMTA